MNYADVMTGQRSWALEHGDSRDVLPSLPPDSFDAIVTSPPYSDQRNYGEWLRPFLAAMLPVVNQDGSLMLNVGRLMRDGQERPIAEDARRVAQEEGWLWLDTVIWHKSNGLCFSSPRYLHSKHEFVWWLGRSTSAVRTFDGGYSDADPVDFAALSLGRRFVGIEENVDYLAEATGRLTAAAMAGSRMDLAGVTR